MSMLSFKTKLNNKIAKIKKDIRVLNGQVYKCEFCGEEFDNDYDWYMHRLIETGGVWGRR